MQLFKGDSLIVLKGLADNSVDSVVTDPPYGLAFMGKKWDYQVPSVELWREVFRVLKPGGHVLSFGGTRTYHRMVVNVEDAGFEIRDQIQWLYGSGFPKSHDVSKGIDKAAGAEREVVGENPNNRPSKRHGAAGFDSENEIGSQRAAELKLTAPSTDAAKQWQGWGTALKPANEPIVLARKPLIGTVAENVQTFGTGALNIDASRIATDDNLNGGAYSGDRRPSARSSFGNGVGGGVLKNGIGKDFVQPQGRWPANVLFDEEAAAVLDAQSGAPGIKRGGNTGAAYGAESREPGTQMSGFGDSGGASRFFYVAKASKRERNAGLEGMPLKESRVKNDSGRGFSEANPYKKVLNQNNHPTVKPVKLMEYLVRLVTPPGGVVLDPFMGSGTTGVACALLGFQFIGVERDQSYLEIAKKRIQTQKLDKQLEMGVS